MADQAFEPMRNGLTPDQDRHKEAILTQPAPSKLGGTGGATVVKHGDLYLLTDEGGDVPWELPHAFGLYMHDCRFVNGLTLTVNGSPLQVLGSSHVGDTYSEHHLTNPGLSLLTREGDLTPHTLSVERSREIRNGGVHESVSMTNHGLEAVQLLVELRARCNFEDLFVVKGFVGAGNHGPGGPAAAAGNELAWNYSGRDGLERSTRLAFDPPPDRISGDKAYFTIALEPRAAVSLNIVITPSIQPNEGRTAPRSELRPVHRRHSNRAEEVWRRGNAKVVASQQLFNRVFDRALLDLKVLRSRLGRRHYFAAGVPWFVTLFGRDAAITAIQTLPFGTGIARETLLLLAEYQAAEVDAYRDAEPGKILHELRRGELANLGEIPQSPAYYGAVDTTMLFLILAARYLAWSGDVETIRRLAPNIERALGWVSDWCDHDGDGYMDYSGEYENGLVNQAWKDSGNAYVNRDGSLVKPPVAAVEVQSYAYRAWRDSARTLRLLGRSDTASELEGRAKSMKERFERDFWSEDLGCYVLALQAGGRPAEVVSSNAGQVLWGGIASPAHARRTAERLLRHDMFSGWGIRTLSTQETSFNPISYHLGSVWPHDNAMILAGMRLYGLDDCALSIFDGLFEAAANLPGFRLPELFCGYQRERSEPPVSYPFASAPQAWAAGALPHCLWSLLGLDPDAPARRFAVRRPVLPGSVEWLELRHLRVGEASVNLRFQRGPDGRVHVESNVTSGQLAVEVTEEVPGEGRLDDSSQ